MAQRTLIKFTEAGLYCPQADVFIDPWKPKASYWSVITHAHADHARTGSGYYLAHHESGPILRHRLGADINLETIAYNQPVYHHGVKISLHPAGHILGSAQVRLEYQGEVWVISGDYKLENDQISTAFEAVPCHAFVTESTFALPVYKWKDQQELYRNMNAWWAINKSEGKNSIIFGYSLGKAQRIISQLDPGIGTIYVHGAIDNINALYREAGVALPPTKSATTEYEKNTTGNIIVAPPSALGTWINKFRPFETAIASGWMRIRGIRRRRAVDQGFILSDHADWPGLLQAIHATGAERVFVTHGYSYIFSRYLRELGLQAQPVETQFEGELDEIKENANNQD